jgi:serine/threonine protein phosphatase PrpC
MRKNNEEMFDTLLSGTTATLLIQTPKKLYIAWIGDSMVTLWGNGREKTRNLFVTDVSHSPELPAEKYRIYDNRGEIRETNDGKQRIFLRARMYPGLKVSRTIGDLIPHQIGVISQPQFKTVELTNNDKYFIMGTDGLWEMMLPE